jgi:hypothetical protein
VHADVCVFHTPFSRNFDKLPLSTQKAKNPEFPNESEGFGGKLGAGDGIRTRDIQNHNLTL